MKTYWGSKGYLHAFLISTLFGVEWSASRPGRFIPGTDWIGGLVGPRAGLDAVAKGKNRIITPDGNRIPVVYPVA
jgi:hypothetical protein